eukprot:364787-Chlamydomonas_euryale.AAC.26
MAPARRVRVSAWERLAAAVHFPRCNHRGLARGWMDKRMDEWAPTSRSAATASGMRMCWSCSVTSWPAERTLMPFQMPACAADALESAEKSAQRAAAAWPDGV